MSRSCKDCRYCVPDTDFTSLPVQIHFATCGHPKAKRFKYCEAQRFGGRLDAYFTRSCGPQARWFELKEQS